MKKLLLYSLTLVGMLVSSTQSAVAQLTNPEYKGISSLTGTYYFYTTQTELQTAFNAKWAADGEDGTFKAYTSSKTALNPETGATDFQVANKSVQIKNSGTSLVYLYVKGITALKVYAYNGGSADRTLQISVIEESDQNFPDVPTFSKTTAKSTSVQGEITDLDASTSYKIKIYADNVLILYCVQFTCKVADVVQAPRIDSDDFGKVTITHAEGTTVKYTTDGTEPTATVGNDYDDETGIVLAENATVKAVAIRTEDGQLSDVVTQSISVIKNIVGMQICTFTESGASNTDYFKSSVATTDINYIVDGVNYTKAWKVQSSDNLIFKTQNNALLKVVLAKRTDKDTYDYKIKVDEIAYDNESEGVIYVELPAGKHSLTRNGSESAVAYIGVFENYSTISNEISTMYYEYPVSLADGLTAYTGTVNGNSVSLTAIEGNVVKKETPVIVKAAAAGTYYINESNVVGAGEAGSLSGTATALTVGSNTYYTLGHKDGDANAEIGFYKFSGTTIPANKAYIDGATVSGAPKFLSIEGDGNTTGIHDTMIDNADVDAPMFNIAGQRVGNNAKGLVIKNGKKYMLK